jgi:hypothetical protein
LDLQIKIPFFCASGSVTLIAGSGAAAFADDQGNNAARLQSEWWWTAVESSLWLTLTPRKISSTLVGHGITTFIEQRRLSTILGAWLWILLAACMSESLNRLPQVAAPCFSVVLVFKYLLSSLLEVRTTPHSSGFFLLALDSVLLQRLNLTIQKSTIAASRKRLSHPYFHQ